jgi:hypothetical protein
MSRTRIFWIAYSGGICVGAVLGIAATITLATGGHV